MQLLEQFFRDLDQSWTRDRVRSTSSAQVRCCCRRTMREAPKTLMSSSFTSLGNASALLALAGKTSALYRKHRIYLDLVKSGVPFLAQAPRWKPAVINDSLTMIELHVLDVVDVVVSKLKRFSANDRNDIAAMIDRNLVLHDELLERFRSAFAWCAQTADAENLSRSVEHLNQVERDLLSVDETSFEHELDGLQY